MASALSSTMAGIKSGRHMLHMSIINTKHAANKTRLCMLRLFSYLCLHPDYFFCHVGVILMASALCSNMAGLKSGRHMWHASIINTKHAAHRTQLCMLRSFSWLCLHPYYFFFHVVVIIMASAMSSNMAGMNSGRHLSHVSIINTKHTTHRIQLCMLRSFS